jgi:hypothetical protein
VAGEGARLEAGQVELPVLPVPLVLRALPVLRALQQGQVEAVEGAEALVGQCSRCLSRA